MAVSSAYSPRDHSHRIGFITLMARPRDSMEKIWKKYWPPSVDESTIRLPEETLPVILERQVHRVPDRAAIIFYGREVTFAELHDAVCRFAGWLQSRGIAPGDRGPSSWRTARSSPSRTSARCVPARSSSA